jgi:hypothetical protein
LKNIAGEEGPRTRWLRGMEGEDGKHADTRRRKEGRKEIKRERRQKARKIMCTGQ